MMIQGMDISWWQQDVDWQKAAENARFCFIRAGSVNMDTGVPYADYNFTKNATDCPLPKGYYWFMRPKFDGKAQARYFLDLLSDKEWALNPVLDIETAGADYATIRRNTLNFVTEVHDQLNVWPIIYTRATYWNAIHAGGNTWAENCDLWVARYHSGIEEPWSDNDYYRPNCWDDWKFWQWSADGNNRGAEFGVESDDIDLNRFNGTEEDFAHYIGAEYPATPPQPGGIVTITVEGLPEGYTVQLG